MKCIALLRRLAVLLLLAAFTHGLAADLRLAFLDVGQGSATLILTPDGRAALIDGGRSYSRIEPALAGFGVTQLALIVASHADADHIGGLVDAVTRYSPAAFLDNGMPHTTQLYSRLMEAVEQSDALYLEGTRRTLTLGDVIIDVLPAPYLTSDQNSNSIGIIVQLGEFRAFLPGDATRFEQDWWLAEYPELLGGINVYAAAHHGSSTGDERDFLTWLDPQVIVISAGAGNSYGHPAGQTLAAYFDVASYVLRTDEDGLILVSVAAEAAEYLVQPGFTP